LTVSQTTMGRRILVNALLALMAVQCSAQVDSKAWDAAAFQKGEEISEKENRGRLEPA
jgi:hypothetical protein